MLFFPGMKYGTGNNTIHAMQYNTYNTYNNTIHAEVPLLLVLISTSICFMLSPDLHCAEGEVEGKMLFCQVEVVAETP